MTRAYHYDVDGLLGITSAVQLHELAFFRVAQPTRTDLEVRHGLVGGVAPRATIKATSDGRRILWREQLGALGANFAIELGSPVVVRVSPLLAISPHVVYTNLVEPLLRFLLVPTGHILLHAASIQIDGQSLLLSARTDTGKTSTILSLLRRHQGVFFSDDMLILGEDGWLSRYPKPLTISAHTVRSTPQNRLGRRSRITLPVQSRLHSRGGRAAGKHLGEMNVPIMGLNALVQALCPPPKYHVTQLVDCAIGDRTRPDRLFLIERGSSDRVEMLGRDEMLDELGRNTEDAYGFPPYGRIRSWLWANGAGYQDLLRRERAILAGALQGVKAVRIVAGDYGWAATIEEGIAGTRTRSAPRSDRVASSR